MIQNVSLVKVNNNKQDYGNTTFKGTSAVKGIPAKLNTACRYNYADLIKDNVASLLTNLINLIYVLPEAANMKWWYGKAATYNLLTETIKVNLKYRLNFDFSNMGYSGYNNYIHLYSTNRINKDYVYLIFDKKTGRLIQFYKNHNIKGLMKDGVIIKSDSSDYIKNDELGNINECTTTITDLNGKILNKSEFKKSDIDGNYENYVFDQNGNRYKTGLAEFDEKCGRHIEKTFVSPDGTKTDYVFADDKIGNRFLYYKITDNSGNVLYENSDKFKVINENHFVSTNNGVSYDIVFDKSAVTVTKLDNQGKKTNEKVIYQIKEYSQSEYDNIANIYEKCWSGFFSAFNHLKENLQKNGLIHKHVVDKNLLPILKQLSGEEWFRMEENNIENIKMSRYGSQLVGKTIVDINKEDRLHLFVLEHEIGHGILKQLENDETFKKIYEEEKKMYMKLLTDIEHKQMEHFLKEFCKNSPIKEMLAEINALLHIPNSDNALFARGMYLMKYFPKTTAYVGNYLKETGF